MSDGLTEPGIGWLSHCVTIIAIECRESSRLYIVCIHRGKYEIVDIYDDQVMVS